MQEEVESRTVNLRQHDEAERTYHSICGPGLSEPQEKCGGKEGA
jgi:hypothetical protein